MQWRDAAADPGKGTPFLMVFGIEPGLTDPDGSKMREMINFGEALKREGKFLETAPLAHDTPPARIGRTLVTDGPFDGESFGLSVFLRDGHEVYRTYFTAGRGVEALGPVWTFLDLTPLGRQEEWEDSPEGYPQTPPYAWWRRHDEYGR